MNNKASFVTNQDNALMSLSNTIVKKVQRKLNHKGNTSAHHQAQHPLISTLFLATALALGNFISIGQVQAAAGNSGFPVLDKAYNATVDKVKGSTLTISADKDKNNALILWKSFDVQKGKAVHFKRSDTNNNPVSFLNVVTGPGRSNIEGNIVNMNQGKSDVNFYLINPNGIRVSESAHILDMHNVYLGTHKVSQQLLDQFKNGAAPAIKMDALANTKGMGKVSLIGSVVADNLKVNGSQIVIADVSKITTPINKNTIELHSSTNRIDVGGDKQDKANFELKSGLKGVGRQQLATNGSHNKDQYVDHFDATALYTTSSALALNDYQNNNFDEITNDMSGKYWLADDLVLQADNRLKGDVAFKGELDGAFHTIKFTGQIGANALVQSNNYGVLGSIEGANISNLKIMSDNLVVKDDLKGKTINLGALAGSIKDSTLQNIEVVDFAYSFEQGLVDSVSNLGALSGKVEGNNNFTNVISYYDDKTQDLLTQKQALGELKHVGTQVGFNDGQINTTLIVAGISNGKAQALLDSVGAGNKQAISSNINEAFNNAYNALVAQGKSKEQALDEIYSSYAFNESYQGGKKELTTGANKGFLKPFFIEDFNFTYDGENHNYQDLVNNEGFKIESLLSKNNAVDFEQKDAGNYGFSFVTADENKDFGHEFFFSYQYANETWDKSQGGDIAIQDRTNRADSLLGMGTLNINKKIINLELKDQVIEHNAMPNLAINRDTINNYDQLINSLAKGDSIGDLNLTLQSDGSVISAIANSKNYEVLISDANLSKKPAPNPIPNPNPMPNPNPNPNPGQKPQPMPQPPVIDKPQVNIPHLPQINPEHGIEDNNKTIAYEVGAQSKCQNCTHYGNEQFLPFAWLVDSSYMSLANLDYSDAVMASVDEDYDHEVSDIFINNKQNLLTKNNSDLTMSTTNKDFKLDQVFDKDYGMLNKLSELAMDIKIKAEYVLSMINNNSEDKSIANKTKTLDLANNNVEDNNS